ncbi:hypothetical protein [Helicobacter cetorum]|uniref:Uncharacterized protein n=1 Tax=Helicobacter cetorum (strain ATCC BAA-540 / CCUG 52418 / MIT 99-5656) TaxID=1163745 RepID=I0ESZ8_HELCM|nr:hypothetical protein [Helicobacter cetorum]AFI06067.1 hypothetical protein HCD_05325 [Helicobacter cetorum MIT 99-5656]
MFPRLCLNFSTFIWVVWAYVLNNTISVNNNNGFPYYYAVIVLIVAVLVSFLLLLFWIKKATKDPEHEQNPIVIQKIYPIHSEQIPAFFAICVVAFSMKPYESYNGWVFLGITLFLFFLFMLHNVSYLNPIWYCLSYRVYRVESLGTNYIFIMHKSLYDNIYKELYNEENKKFAVFRVGLDKHTWFILEINEKEIKEKKENHHVR